jgi:hypothetical protein
MKMPVKAFTPFMDFLAETDNYSSLQFTRKYHEYGQFELHINRYMHDADKFDKGTLIMLNKETNKAGIILHKEIALDQNGKATENWKLTGVTLQGIMMRRVTVPPADTGYDRKSGDAETVMKHYVERNFINPDDPKRKIPQLEIAPNLHRGSHVEWESRYKRLSDELANISKLSGLGWTIYVDMVKKKWIFDVVEGRNLTQEQQEHSPVFFSPEFGTVKSQQFTDSSLNYRNFGYVGGQGEGEEREIVTVGEAEGFNRIETFIDARDVDTETDEGSNGESLIERGQRKLDEMQTELYLEAEILTPITKETRNHNPNSTVKMIATPFEYEKDFDLGDNVPVLNKSWGIMMTAPITEFKEIYESNGFQLEGTFGESQPTLISKINKKFDELSGVEQQEAPAKYAKLKALEALGTAEKKISDEELARIKQAQENLSIAKQHAKEQAEAARVFAAQKAQEAQEAAEEVARQEAALSEEQSKAYADGKVSEEEQARLLDIQATLGEAEAKAKLAKTEAQAYADGIVTAEEEARIAEAKAKLAEAKEHADTKASEAQEAAINAAALDAKAKAEAAQAAAEQYALAQAEAERVKAEAYADGKVDDEEQARIQQANANLQAAKTHADQAAADAETAANAYTNSKLTNYIDATLYSQKIDELQAQIDNQIESHFFAYEPTLSNAPASRWMTNAERQKHIGDLFYNTDTGYSYRFALDGTTYKWVLVRDEGIAKALADAANAQDTADSKRRVFVSQPTTPYDTGDLWDNGGTVYRSTVTKTSAASFSVADWVKIGDVTSKNTSKDTSNVGGRPSSTIEDKDGSQAKADSAESNAKNHANTVAEEAEQNANNYTEAYAEKAIHKGTTPPSDTTQLWLDTSGTVHVLRRWDGTIWKALAPLSPGEIGAVDSSTYNSKIQELTLDISEKADAEYINGQLVIKADADDVYTKVETDTKLKDKADSSTTYTKTEVDNALNSKVSSTKFTTDMNGVISDLENHESRIKQTEDEIQSKVSSTDYNQKVIELEGDISDKANSSDVYTKASIDTKLGTKANTSTVNAIETRISDAETAITQNDTEISLKANKTDVYTKTEVNTSLSSKADNSTVSAIETRVSDTEAELSVQADKIESRVTKTEFDNLEIGGRNLIKSDNYEENSSYQTVTKTEETIYGQSIYKGVKKESGTPPITFANLEIKKGETFTASVYVNQPQKGPDKDVLIIFYDTVGRRELAMSRLNSFGDWERLEVTFKGISDSTSAGVYFYLPRGVGEEAYFACPKVEKGNKATDWTPAPEDVDSAIDDVNERVSSAETRITQTEKVISLKASKSEVYTTGEVDNKLGSKASQSSLNTTNNNVSNLTSRMSSAESELSVQADKIESKVSESTYTDDRITSGVEGDATNWGTLDGSNKGKWYRIAYNTGSRAWARFIIVDTTPSQHGTVQFTAGVNYNKRDNIDFSLLSFSMYSNFPFSKARILTGGTYDEQYLDLYFNPGREDNTSSVKYLIKDNIQSTGWTPVDFQEATVPSGHVASEFEISKDQAITNRMSTAESSITQNADEIKSKVSQSTYDIDIPNLKSRMSSTESSVTQNADNISSKVEKTDYNGNKIASLINQSATDVLIQAAKILLDGYVEAKHIKSLNGLNVNGQFIVDANGNVKFKGNLDGASGTFRGKLEGGEVRGSSFTSESAPDSNGKYESLYADKGGLTISRYGEGTVLEMITRMMGDGFLAEITNGPSVKYGANGVTASDGLYVNGKKSLLDDPDRILWSGAIYLNESQEAPATKKLSECNNGWILVWGRYSGGSIDSDYNISLIPKDYPNLTGGGMWIPLMATADETCYKYIYVLDDKIYGHSRNNDYPQNGQVLRYILSF